MARSSSYYDVRDALKKAGCPICRLNAATAERYLDILLWEMVNDPGVRKKIRVARGFCNTHAWQMARLRGAPLGIAIIHHDVLNAVLKDLETVGVASPSPWQAALDALGGERSAARGAAGGAGGPCPACAHIAEAEKRYLEVLLGHLADDAELRAAFGASAGLCHPHLRQALSLASNEEAAGALIGAQRSIWERLSAQLEEFMRKNDYRFRAEPMGEESDAWLRSIAALSGENYANLLGAL